MKILITGNRGYVGAVLGRHLRTAIPDACLVGFDSGYFAQALTNTQTDPEPVLDEQHSGDIRDFPADLLRGVDAVVQLAAISNDPMGDRFAVATREINCDATVRLAMLAAHAGVSHFVFASSCSVYGFAEGSRPRREDDPLNPQTSYARSKIDAENALAGLDAGRMLITCARFATACGMSDRLRLDLVLNDFVASAVATGRIAVLSDGTPWRPLIDVRDMARAIEWAVTRGRDAGGPKLSVNVGAGDSNHQVKEIAAAVAQAISGITIRVNAEAPPDARSYQVDFSRFARLAPGHQPRVGLRDSIATLHDGLRAMGFADTEFRNSSFMRLKVLEAHIAAGRLSNDLRWTTSFPGRGQKHR